MKALSRRTFLRGTGAVIALPLLERRLVQAEEWETKPKPKTDLPKPQDTEFLLERLGAMYDLIHLAIATDSTRAITLMIRLDGFTGKIPGVNDEPHNLSHHSNRPDKIAQLEALETAEFQLLAKFLGKLSSVQEQGASLLDRTSILYGSNIADGSSHDWHNLPILLAGGGFKHGQHLAFDRKNNTPLSNLLLSMLQRQGVEANAFGSSTGTLTGLQTT